MDTLLFVYGTLMTGRSAHEQYAQPAERLGEACLPGLLFNLPGGYPGVVVSPEQVLTDTACGSSVLLNCRHPQQEAVPLVHGELLRLLKPIEQLPRLDRYEDAAADGSGEYRRVLAAVWSGGEWKAAWIYCLTTLPSGRPMVDGRWSDHALSSNSGVER